MKISHSVRERLYICFLTVYRKRNNNWNKESLHIYEVYADDVPWSSALETDIYMQFKKDAGAMQLLLGKE